MAAKKGNLNTATEKPDFECYQNLDVWYSGGDCTDNIFKQ
jgi:hypothetical protein